VVWLYAGGVSLIFPDVWLGTVSQDWVTYTAYVILSDQLQYFFIFQALSTVFENCMGYQIFSYVFLVSGF